jgi:hypothetical protein
MENLKSAKEQIALKRGSFRKKTDSTVVQKMDDSSPPSDIIVETQGGEIYSSRRLQDISPKLELNEFRDLIYHSGFDLINSVLGHRFLLDSAISSPFKLWEWLEVKEAKIELEDTLDGILPCLGQFLNSNKYRGGTFVFSSLIRSRARNKKIGGKSTSRHLLGKAVDIMLLNVIDDQDWFDGMNGLAEHLRNSGYAAIWRTVGHMQHIHAQ